MNSPNQPKDQSEVFEFYRHRLAEDERLIANAEQRTGRFSKLRGAAFFVAVGALLLGFYVEDIKFLAFATAITLVGIFMGLIVVHESIIRNVNVAKIRRYIHRIQLARLDRDWEKIPVDDVEVPTEFRALSQDLGLFGKASMFQLFSRCHTPHGIETFKNWILQPAEPKEIDARQQAVRCLADRSEYLEELDLKGRLLAASESGPAEFVDWAESEPWLTPNSALCWSVRLLTFFMIITIVGSFFGLIATQFAIIAFFAQILISVFVNVFTTGRIHDIFNRVDSKSNDIAHYQDLFHMVDALPEENEWLSSLKSQMQSKVGEPSRLLRKLAKIMRLANLRRNAFIGAFHVIFQMLFYWDFHALLFVESWQIRYGSKVRPWFESLGRLEAIATLASIAHDYPAWSYPKVTDGDTVKQVEAKSIRHPYLPLDVGVSNDVIVGPTGKLLLVTGSNMSGKSTLLRSLGVNVHLAQMGAPVCAQALSLPKVVVATSMRVQDSLEDGVSFFMAELQQLKGIVDHSIELRDSDWTLFFLLDEILQGTNSVERHIAVARVVHRLVANGAIGAVSTHDLELAKHPDLVDLCQPVHFREVIDSDQDEGKMTFDYKMKDGLATTTNALKLLKLVGLEEDR